MMAHNALAMSNTLHLLVWAAPVVILVVGYVVLRVLYVPRSMREWKQLLVNPGARSKLRCRKLRLDAIRARRPGSILPGVPVSERDFALEPMIRGQRFGEAKAYIMEKIRQYRDTGGATSERVRIYLQYLELIEGTV